MSDSRCLGEPFVLKHLHIFVPHQAVIFRSSSKALISSTDVLHALSHSSYLPSILPLAWSQNQPVSESHCYYHYPVQAPLPTCRLCTHSTNEGSSVNSPCSQNKCMDIVDRSACETVQNAKQCTDHESYSSSIPDETMRALACGPKQVKRNSLP